MDEALQGLPPVTASSYVMPVDAAVSLTEQPGYKRCANVHCQKENEKTWRKANGLLYCNACACYLKEHRRQRPLHLIQRTMRQSPPAQGEVPQSTAQLMTASSLDSSLLQTAPSAPSPMLDRYASSSCISEQQLFHKLLPPVRTHRSRSSDEDEYRPGSALHSTAALPRRAKRARTQSLVDSNFVAGVPDSPLNDPDYSPSSSGTYGSDAATAAAVLLMMKTGQALCIPQPCITEVDADDYKPPPAKNPRRRRAEVTVADAYAEDREVKQCANCGTTESGGGAWRRYKGARMCNACGVYPKQKEHLGEMRPISCIEKAAKKARQQVRSRAEAALAAAGAIPPLHLPPTDTPHAGDVIEAYYNGGMPGACVDVVMRASPPLQGPAPSLYCKDMACTLDIQPSLSAAVPLNRALFFQKR